MDVILSILLDTFSSKNFEQKSYYLAGHTLAQGGIHAGGDFFAPFAKKYNRSLLDDGG
jgi:hypothetical protein